jgi:16S rRNA (cytosine967-C5)-methyltransferase
MSRLTAWKVLRNGKRGLRDVNRFAEHDGLDGRERALTRRLVGTEIRRRATLRALVAAFTHGKANSDVAAHLRLGFVQLFFLDGIPSHAAVSETVSATHQTSGPSKARYVNAVLRTAQRACQEGTSGDPRSDLPGRNLTFDTPIFRDPIEHPLLWIEDALSMPAPLVKKWTTRYGAERATELARTALEEPPLSVRVIRKEGHSAREELMAELAAFEPRPTEHEDVLLFDGAHTEELVNSSAFQEGRVTVQGETALRAAELCQAQEGERVLELAAAPGGKTAVLASTGASIIACDLNADRLARLGETIARLGCSGSVQVVASDGTGGLRAPESGFDAVLADVPCSNTGVLAQRPEARWRYGPSAQRSLGELQARLLREGASVVRPGGRLIYSTCSLEPEENRLCVRTFLQEAEGWTLEEELEALPDHANGPVDGGYSARLRKG